MVRKEDKEILVHCSTQAKQGISQKGMIACLVIGIAILSLLIYLFILALNPKQQPDLFDDVPVGPEPVSHCPDVDFDYLLLAVRWPLSDCTEGQCVHDPPNHWVIHGLWPNYSNGTWPEYCCRSRPFQEEAIHQLEPRLKVGSTGCLRCCTDAL